MQLEDPITIITCTKNTMKLMNCTSHIKTQTFKISICSTAHCTTYLFLLFKLPGRKGTGAGGWMIQAKLQVYFWLGSIKHKKSYPSGLPPGFQVTNELLNAERPGLPPPTAIHYAEKHVSHFLS